MFRASLCLAAAAFALMLAPGDVRAHGHGHHHDVHVHRSFFGFLDYRHSVDPWDSPDYRAYRNNLDRKREYVFHSMTAAEAYSRWHGHGHRRSHGHALDGKAQGVASTTRWGGGDHNDAWGVHSSDHHHDH